MLNNIPMKKGIVQIIPVLVAAAVLSLGVIGLVATQRSQEPEIGNVLSSSNQNKGQGQNKKEENKGNSSQGSSANTQSQSSNKNESKSQKSEGKEGTANETKETINTLETENELEIEEENDEIEEATTSASSGRKIRTNFPITVNPLTNEKTVTTPSGTKTIILPEVAIQNMINAGFPVVLPPEPSPSPSSSPEATPSATPSATPEASPSLETEDGSIVLTELNNELVYEIPAIKNQKFLGLFSVKIKVKGYVSAENGDILQIKKSLFDNIVDFLSI